MDPSPHQDDPEQSEQPRWDSNAATSGLETRNGLALRWSARNDMTLYWAATPRSWRAQKLHGVVTRMKTKQEGASG